MVKKPSAAMMRALRDFVFRHEIFVEAREFDDGFIFRRLPRRGSKRVGPRRHFEMFLRREERRVKFFTVTCGSEDHERSQIAVDFPEKVLVMAAEAAIEYEECGRSATSRSQSAFARCAAALEPPSTGATIASIYATLWRLQV